MQISPPARPLYNEHFGYTGAAIFIFFSFLWENLIVHSFSCTHNSFDWFVFHTMYQKLYLWPRLIAFYLSKHHHYCRRMIQSGVTPTLMVYNSLLKSVERSIDPSSASVLEAIKTQMKEYEMPTR
jgi:hypothetical protein